jgi:hypothetical protein
MPDITVNEASALPGERAPPTRKPEKPGRNCIGHKNLFSQMR